MASEATVVGSGDPATDSMAISAAATSLRLSGGGTLKIEKEVQLNARIVLGTHPISLVGVGHDAALLGVASTAGILWGPNYDPVRDPMLVPYVGASASDWEIENPTIDLSDGDWFTIWSDDNLTGCPPHLGYQRPMELHQVKETRAGKIVFDDFLAHDMVTNAQIAKAPMTNGVTVANLKLRYSGSQQNTRFFDFRCIDGLRIENVDVEPGGPGPCLITHCANVDLSGFNCYGKHNWDLDFGYHVVFGLVNKARFRDSFVTGCRHAFTTTGMSHGRSTPSAIKDVQWGTPRHWSVESVTAHQNGWPMTATRPGGAALPPFDTHANGHGGRFIDCEAHVPADAINYAFNLRAQNTEVINCTTRGGGGRTKGVCIWASDCKILGGTVEGVLVGISVNKMNGHIPARTLIKGATIQNCDGVGVLVENCNSINLEQLSIRHCGAGSLHSAGYPQTAIWLKNGQNAQIFDNSLCKYGNLSPVQVETAFGTREIYGNLMLGYGTGQTSGNYCS